MAASPIESDFRASKMADGGHFVEKKNQKKRSCIDLKWQKVRSKVIL